MTETAEDRALDYARQLARLREAAAALLHHDTPTNRANLWHHIHPDLATAVRFFLGEDSRLEKREKPSGCGCPCHAVIQPGLVPCPQCAHSSRSVAPGGDHG